MKYRQSVRQRPCQRDTALLPPSLPPLDQKFETTPHGRLWPPVHALPLRGADILVFPEEIEGVSGLGVSVKSGGRRAVRLGWLARCLPVCWAGVVHRCCYQDWSSTWIGTGDLPMGGRVLSGPALNYAR